MLLTIDGRRVHYDLVGPDSAPVVCLAHTLSSDMGIWSEQVPALLAAGFRVLRIDMRGHGGSEVGEGPWSMAALAQDVVSVLDRLGIDRVHFAGVSIGGMIGQVLGIAHADRLLSLALCCTSAQAVPGGQAMWDARFAAIRAAASVEPLADDTVVRWFTAPWRAQTPPRVAQVRATVANTPVEGYIGGAEAIIAFDVLADLPSIRVPTLVVSGDDDPGTPAEGNRAIAAAIPGARYVEIAPARHIPMIEHADRFNALLLEWLASAG